MTSLVEHYHCLKVRVRSNEDTLVTPVLYVRSDPPPRHGRPEDAFFFYPVTPGVSIIHQGLTTM
jgi:hypothetical protein